MTLRSVRGPARALFVALLLAAAAPPARAGDLYRWVTEDGRVEIGPTPPAGTAAVPWRPGQRDAATPGVPEAPARAARTRSRNAKACARDRESEREDARRIAEVESEIARLEQKIERLETSEVAWSRTSCRSQGIYGPKSDCVASRFDRDAEIEGAKLQLDSAQERLADLEQRARRDAPADDCPASSAD